jgi:hypothetical protein
VALVLGHGGRGRHRGETEYGDQGWAFHRKTVLKMVREWKARSASPPAGFSFP